MQRNHYRRKNQLHALHLHVALMPFVGNKIALDLVHVCQTISETLTKAAVQNVLAVLTAHLIKPASSTNVKIPALVSADPMLTVKSSTIYQTASANLATLEILSGFVRLHQHYHVITSKPNIFKIRTYVLRTTQIEGCVELRKFHQNFKFIKIKIIFFYEVSTLMKIVFLAVLGTPKKTYFIR